MTELESTGKDLSACPAFLKWAKANLSDHLIVDELGNVTTLDYVARKARDAWLSVPRPSMAQPAWSKAPPMEQRWFWFWDGELGSPLQAVYVTWSEADAAAFVQAPALGLEGAKWCHDLIGWWLPMTTPVTPEFIQKASKQ